MINRDPNAPYESVRKMYEFWSKVGWCRLTVSSRVESAWIYDVQTKI